MALVFSSCEMCRMASAARFRGCEGEARQRRRTGQLTSWLSAWRALLKLPLPMRAAAR